MVVEEERWQSIRDGFLCIHRENLRERRRNQEEEEEEESPPRRYRREEEEEEEEDSIVGCLRLWFAGKIQIVGSHGIMEAGDIGIETVDIYLKSSLNWDMEGITYLFS